MGDPLALILIMIVGVVVFYGMFSGNKNKHKRRKTAANERIKPLELSIKTPKVVIDELQSSNRKDPIIY